MARSEARVLVSIWGDEDFVAMSRDAQWAYMFLISQPDLEHDGVLALRVGRWARKAKGLSIPMIEDALHELESARYVVIDRDCEELLVRTHIRNDGVYQQPNLLKSAAKHLATVESAAIRVALAVELTRVRAMAGDLAQTEIDAMLAVLPAPRPSPNPPGNPSVDPSAVGSPEGTADGSADPSASPSRNPLGERGVVTAVTTGFPYPLSPEPLPLDPAPPQGASPPGAAPAASQRGTRIPLPFVPSAEMLAWAKERAPRVDLAAQTEMFVNHWTAKVGRDATKRDWPATWRNWILRAPTFAGHGRASPLRLVEHNGLQLKPETAARLEGRERFAAMDAAKGQTAIGGSP